MRCGRLMIGAAVCAVSVAGATPVAAAGNEAGALHPLFAQWVSAGEDPAWSAIVERESLVPAEGGEVRFELVGMAAESHGPGASPHEPPIWDPSTILAEPFGGDTEPIRRGGGDFGFQAVTNTGWTPPDPHMAVGPDHIVVMTNGEIAFFEKDGTRTFRDEIEDSFGFWGSVGATGFVFDPETLYDPLSGRFFAMAAEGFAPGSRSYILLAVSDDSDPNGTWFKYRFDVTSFAGDLLDSPNMGVDDQAVYLTGDYWGPTSYLMYIVDKASVLAGNPPAVTNAFRIATSTQSWGIPDVMFGSPGVLYMIEHLEGASNAAVRLHALSDPLGSPTITTTSLAVPTYGSPPEDPPQQGTGSRPEAFDVRFWSAAFDGSSLWAAHHINSDRVIARWYEIAMNGWPNSGDAPALVQWGNIDPGAGIRTFFVSVTADLLGNAAVTYSRSSPGEFISMGTAFRRATDPLGVMGNLTVQKSSNGPYTAGRWGDYSAVRPDPVAPGRFWAHHEYAINNSWNTWVAEFGLAGVPGDFDGDGDVDIADFAFFSSCFTGSGVPCSGSCCAADLDGDGDVDIADFSIFSANFTGSQ